MNNYEFREYNIYFPKAIADLIKREARTQGVTEQELIKRWVADRLTDAPAEKVVYTEQPGEMPVAA